MQSTSAIANAKDGSAPRVAAVAGAWAALRLAPADARAWLELARRYAQQGLSWQLNYAARQALRCDPSVRADAESLTRGAVQDTTPDAVLGRAPIPDAPALAERFCEALRVCADDWLTWLYVARLEEAPGVKLPFAQGHALAQAQSLEIIRGETLHWLGVWRLNAGDAKGAVEALATLVDARPLRHGSMMYLGEALVRLGNLPAAEKAFTRASLLPNVDFLLALSARVYGHNYWQEALAVLQKALALKPASVPVLLALARIQSEVYALADCRATLERLRTLDPGNREAVLLQAGLQGRVGDARGHLETLLSAYEAGGDPLSRLASSVAMTSLYHDGLAPDEVAGLHRGMCAPIESAHPRRTDFRNARSGARRVRIGYVTGDLHRQHPVGVFMLPVLQRHDRAKFDVCVYHTGVMQDSCTRAARASASRWREAAALDDRALREAIVTDEVDILVDLAGHTSTHRLGLFAMGAAPVQATFLGYPHSTGLGALDWLVGDATVAPEAHAQLFSEGIAQLPHSVFCWAPTQDYPLPPARPAGADVVFGSFNNAMKLSPRTIALWSQVLAATPGSRLLLKAPSLRDAEVRARFAALFAAHGIGEERILFRGPTGLAEMMQEYGDMDIALDPLPYNGGTTSLQALWMGVPLITLAGGNFAARMGASFLASLGRPEWVAADEAGYVARAAALAGEVAALRAQRADLRAAMARTPLCDIDTYVRHLEALYGRMWAHHCSGASTRILPAETG